MGKMLKIAIAFVCIASVLAPGSGMSAQQEKKPVDFAKSIKPFMKKYCNSCHSGDHPADGIDYTKFSSMDDVTKNPRAWRKGGGEVRGKQMPPKDAKQPTDKERQMFVDWASSIPKKQ